MIGEIRDKETGTIAIEAALTGHLVLSTLHTNDAPSAITRLIDMGVEPYLLSSALIGVIAQRLVRTICPECLTHYVATPELMRRYGWEGEGQVRLARGRGCPECYDAFAPVLEPLLEKVFESGKRVGKPSAPTTR